MKEEKNKNMIVSCSDPKKIYGRLGDEICPPAMFDFSPFMKFMGVIPFLVDMSEIKYQYLTLLMILYYFSRPKLFSGMYLLRNSSQWIRIVSQNTFQKFYDDN